MGFERPDAHGHAVEVASKPDDVGVANRHAVGYDAPRIGRGVVGLGSAAPQRAERIAKPRVHSERPRREPLLEECVVDDEREVALGASPALERDPVAGDDTSKRRNEAVACSASDERLSGLLAESMLL